MPTTPKMVTLTNSSVDVLNAIRNSASVNYQDYVPIATPNAESIREIGNVIMDYPSLQNEFLNALINRIGRVLITSRMYQNPWSMFKKGLLDYGETIEEVFVNIAKPYQYDIENSEDTVFKRTMPNVKSAFHILNYQEFYPVTIQDKDLRKAFLSWDGITDLIGRIVDSLYSAANLDEFLVMKYLLARNILKGQIQTKDVPETSTANMKQIVSTIKGVSNQMEFMSTNWNLARVHNYATKDRQYIIVNSQFDATMDVEVLAAAFNMDKAEFMGHKVLVDSFGTLDDQRLNLLFKDDPNYVALTTAEKQALDAIPAVLVDEDWFMIYDNLYNFTEQYNAKGMYWNYFYHVWKTFSTSPFANACVFVPGTPAVTSVTVTPSTVSAQAGQTVQLSAKVVTSYFASQEVNWEIDGTGATIDNAGNVTLSDTATGTYNVTATSAFDPSKSGTATITVTATT